jgi:hypothetical protein
MQTLAQRAYLDSEFGSVSELPSVGSSLENPYVYDASAREILVMAYAGLVKIVDERHAEGRDDPIDRLTFTRLR